MENTLINLTPTLQILTLHFVVLSFDRYSRDDVVGEVRELVVSLVQVMVELEGMDLTNSETCPMSLAREITPRSDKLRSQVTSTDKLRSQVTSTDKLRSQVTRTNKLRSQVTRTDKLRS